MIKKLTCFSMTLAILMVISCKKDTTTGTSNFSVVKKWYYNDLITHVNNFGSTTITKDTIHFKGTGSYVEFFANGRALEKQYNFGTSTFTTDSASYSINGQNLIIISDSNPQDTLRPEILNPTDTSFTYHLIQNLTSVNKRFESWLYLTVK